MEGWKEVGSKGEQQWGKACNTKDEVSLKVLPDFRLLIVIHQASLSY